MGYTTDFEGEITVSPALSDEFVARWNEAKKGTPAKPYVSSIRRDASGQLVTEQPDMLPGFEHPAKPQAWCCWELEQRANGETAIQWDWGEKFYEYDDWLQVLVDVIRRESPGCTFDGEIDWRGEEPGDLGRLSIDATGKVRVQYGTITYA